MTVAADAGRFDRVVTVDGAAAERDAQVWVGLKERRVSRNQGARPLAPQSGERARVRGSANVCRLVLPLIRPSGTFSPHAGRRALTLLDTERIVAVDVLGPSNMQCLDGIEGRRRGEGRDFCPARIRSLKSRLVVLNPCGPRKWLAKDLPDIISE
jgi:hypothetical protein